MSEPVSSERVPCPWCAEPIMAQATVCRFCGRATHTPEPAAKPESSGYGCLVVGLLLMGAAIIAVYLGVTSNYG